MAIQRSIAHELGHSDILVETVAKIQGLTTDITIFVIPNTGYHYGLERRLFNVATSRAREHTIIIMDKSVFEHKEIDCDVNRFLRCLVKEESLYKSCSIEINSGNEQDVLSSEIEELPTRELDLGGKDVSKKVEVYDLSRLQASLNTLQVQLMKWLKIWLPIVYSENAWRDGVVKKLSELQYKSIKSHGILSVEGLDLNELLSVFIGSFREFQQVSHISQELQTLAFHVRDIRHSNAHRRTCEIVNMDVSDIKYHIDTVDRFLVGLNKATEPKLNKPITTIVRGKNKFIVS
jgi:hypothetical protein